MISDGKGLLREPTSNESPECVLFRLKGAAPYSFESLVPGRGFVGEMKFFLSSLPRDSPRRLEGRLEN